MREEKKKGRCLVSEDKDLSDLIRNVFSDDQEKSESFIN